MSDKDNNTEKIELIARKVMDYARDSILVNMRFLDVAISALKAEQRRGLSGFASDGEKLYYDPVFLLKSYQEESAFAVRMYLHILFHLIFYHSFRYDKMDKELWNLSADMAVEAAILELEMPGLGLRSDEEKERKLRGIRQEIGALNAEKLYRYFKNFGISAKERGELSLLFFMDSHVYWEPGEELAITPQQWKKLSERVQADLKSFSRGKTKSESIEKNLAQAVKDRVRYSDLLSRFTMMNEDMQINDDEFDYIYYTYGLKTYGNMPLVEPLEYQESNRVREFVIALDTSGSCSGELIRNFVTRTYDILRESEGFGDKVNIHLIQCDNKIQADLKIENVQDLEKYCQQFQAFGFGGTDFRPVFEYVNELCDQGEFENLRGLIYFTDGLGTFPTTPPAYETAFVFMDDGASRIDVPPWAMKVVMDEEEIFGL